MFIAQNPALHRADGLGGRALPEEIDLGADNASDLLTQFEAGWQVLPAWLRPAAIDRLRLTVPPPPSAGEGVLVLAGGAVALRSDLLGVLVADPQTASVLGSAGSARLRAVLAGQSDVITLTHDRAGLRRWSGLPQTLPAQACSLLPDAAPLARLLPAARRWAGPVLVQWRPQGAVVWAMAAAPDCLALAVAFAGTTVTAEAAPLTGGAWTATGTEARIEWLAPGLFDHVDELLTDEVGDALRGALAEHAVSGAGSVAARLVEALRLLPAPFGPDPDGDAGAALLAAWPRATAAMHGAELAMIGLDGGVTGPTGLAALRAVLGGEGLLFAERPAARRTAPMAGAAAEAIAARLDEGHRFGALLAPPASPAELFGLGANLARRTGARVVMAVPGWNFFHRFDPRDDAEAGNAAWFGMGAGLDELFWL